MLPALAAVLVGFCWFVLSIQKWCDRKTPISIDQEVHLIACSHHPLRLMDDLASWFRVLGMEREVEVIEDAVEAEGAES